MTLNNTMTIPNNAIGSPALTCSGCGHTGSEVAMYQVYIGGQGEVLRPECTNKAECWVRMGWGKICSFTEEYCPIGKSCLDCEVLAEYKEAQV